MATPNQTAPPWAAASLVIATGLFTLLGFTAVFTYAVSSVPGTEVNLPMLVIGGVISLLGALAFIVVAYSLFGLHNPQQALGLPEGSVRALVAMMLIVIFSIFVVYFFDRLDTQQREGQADFAKQVITLMGTLLTAIVSFYFAARTATDAAATVTSSPALSAVSPVDATAGASATLTITGTNLQPITKVRLVREDVIDATNVVAAAGQVTAVFAVPAAAEKGKWDVVVETADGKSVRLAQAFEVK